MRRLTFGLSLVAAATLMAGCASTTTEPAGTAPTDSAQSTPTESSQSSAVAGLRGSTWRLASITSGSTVYPVPTAWRTTLLFYAAGQLQIDDTVNSLGGTYRLTDDGYVASDVYSTLVGYAGKDPNRTRVIDALDSLGYNIPKGSTGPSQPVRAVLSGDNLTLTSATFTVAFTRSGGVPTPLAAPSSTDAPPEPTGQPITGSESPN